MKWITREKVKVDRVAAPGSSLDSLMTVLNSSSCRPTRIGRQYLTVIVYDVHDCELGHHGEDLSFQSLLKKYHLEDRALRLLGQIVQAADSHPRPPHPAGEGLRWIAHGFSALGLCDREILEREFVVYDALYAECKRRVLGAEQQIR